MEYKVTSKHSMELNYALIYSKHKQGIEVYGSCSNVNIVNEQIIQNKLMKLLLTLDPKTPTDELHRDTEIFKQYNIYITVTYGNLWTKY